MQRNIALAVLAIALSASQAWAVCEKTAYVDSVRAYSGNLNSHVFVREKGVNSALFVANTTSARFLRGAVQAHVNRTPVQITTVDPFNNCNTPSSGLWTNIGGMTSLIVAP